MAKCVSCNSRKGKRNCPALAGLICSQCCGSKKLKEIDCPDDCFYMAKSQQYFTDRQESKQISDFEREMSKIVGNEDKYLDILQNIEFIIHKIYIDKRNITDKHVKTALDYLIEMGKAQMDLPSKFLTELPPNVQNIVNAIDGVFQSREVFTNNTEQLMDRLKCIHRILDSVKTHHNPKNDFSYLDFIGHFLR
ncbi:MAG: hypothetical protein HQK64_00900 [Desulfamplus sp.]|nr:hypothetical protein [Desulfamplus sp.]